MTTPQKIDQDIREQMDRIDRILRAMPYGGMFMPQIQDGAAEYLSGLADYLTGLAETLRLTGETHRKAVTELDELHAQRDAVRQFLGTGGNAR